MFQERLHAAGIDRPIKDITVAYHLADKYFMREFPGVLGKHFKEYANKYEELMLEYLKVQPSTKIPNEDEESKLKWTAFPETLPTLQKLKHAGFGIGLISNWDPSARDVLSQTGIDKYLDYAVISSEVKVEKPNEEIFYYGLKKADVSPEESLYIGDNYYDDVLGSQRVGMDSMLINPYGRLGIEEVKDVPIIRDVNALKREFLNDLESEFKAK